jgi:hypothetical protein
MAALDVTEQERWLDLATARRLTIRQLRYELTGARSSLGTVRTNFPVAAGEQRQSVDLKAASDVDHLKQLERSRAANSPSRRVVNCPQGGHVFTASAETAGVGAISDAAVARSPASDCQLNDVTPGTLPTRHGPAANT